jgi:WD40 repeat protein
MAERDTVLQPQPPLASVSPDSDSVSCLAFQPLSAPHDPPPLATGHASGLVTIHARGGSPYTLPAAAKGVNDVAWTSDGVYLYVAYEGGSVRVWDVNAEAYVARFAAPEEDEAAICIASAPQANVLAVGHYGGTVNLWDGRAPPSRLIRGLPRTHDGPVTSVDFDPDGTALLTSGMDGLATIVDSTSGNCLAKLMGSPHLGLCYACFSPNARYALTRSLDEGGALGLWELKEVGAMTRSRRYVRGEPKGEDCVEYWMNCCFVNGLVVAGFGDGQVVAWDAGGKHVVAQAALASVVPLVVEGALDGGWLAAGGIGSSVPCILKCT